MTRNSTRSYWLANDKWYKIVNGEFVLIAEAPPEARRSFAEWHRPRKMSLRRRLRRIRAFFW